MTDLGTFGGLSSAALGINDSGQITGWANTTYGSAKAFLWNGGVMTDLGAALADSNGYAINNNGQVVGTANFAGPYSAFMWNGGTATNLGTLGGQASYASGINEFGQIVGTASTGGAQHAFLWSGGVMTDLGLMGTFDTRSHAFGINNHGQIVGYADANGAFLYDGSMLPLGSLLPVSSSSSWSLYQAKGINDASQITGWGDINGQTHAFLMTPVPIPTAFWLFGSGLIGLLGFMRRGRIQRNS